MSEEITIRDKNAIKVRRALLSVSDKSGLVELAEKLHEHGVEILSTGGTAKTLKDAGIPVKDVSAHTGFPEIMDGRVKTLHPMIHGGLLARRDDESHKNAMAENGIESIDLLVVNLYPFSETVQSGAEFSICVENIDVGGPAMIRAAAKNHEFVAVATDPQDYVLVIEELEKHDGALTSSLRKRLAANAFSMTATYDCNISGWFAQQMEEFLPRRVSFSGDLKQALRYGENPHQQAALYLDGMTRPGVATASQIQGKELSYNNLNDTDAAFELVAEFDEPTVAIIKHANPCGVASAADTLTAYKQALACDPVSAFGGIIALNKMLTAETATEIIKLFCEVIIAPSIEAEAMGILAEKKNVRVLTTGALPDLFQKRRMVKSIAGGLLVQDSDTGRLDNKTLRVVTDREPTAQEFEDLLFAFRVAKHVKSNAIVYAKDRATVGVGAGQMSRVDSTRIAAQKARDVDIDLKGSVVASDAFFPFPDGLITAAEAGATAVIQPGGSIRDEQVIEAANERGLAMVFTDIRHFRH